MLPSKSSGELVIFSCSCENRGGCFVVRFLLRWKLPESTQRDATCHRSLCGGYRQRTSRTSCRRRSRGLSVRCGAQLPILGAFVLGSSLSLQSFSNLGSSESCPYSVLDFAHFGSSLSLRVKTHFGSAFPLFQGVSIGCSRSILESFKVRFVLSFRTAVRTGARVSVQYFFALAVDVVKSGLREAGQRTIYTRRFLTCGRTRSVCVAFCVWEVL